MLLKYDSRQILLERLQKMTSEISYFCLDQGHNIILSATVESKSSNRTAKEMDLGLYIDRASMAMKVSKRGAMKIQLFFIMTPFMSRR